MKKISEALRKKGLSSKSLPEDLQKDIAELREDILSYNEACEQFEKERGEDEDGDKEAEKKLDETQDSLAERELEISEMILNYESEKTEPAPTPAPAASAKKEDSSVGWLIFGGVVLALTLGAVNLMKKR